MLQVLRRAFSLVGPARRRKFGLVGVLAVVVSGLEAAAAILILFLLNLVLNPGEIPSLPVFGDPRAVLGSVTYENLVVGFGIVFAVFFLLRGAAFLLQQYAVARLSENTGVLLAHELVDGYLSMPYEFHLGRNSAELIRNAYDNVQQVVQLVFKPLAMLFAESVLVLALLTVLLVTSPLATVGAAVLLTLTIATAFAFVQPRLKRLGHQRQVGARGAIQHIQQGLGGLRDIKIAGRERAFSASFRRARAEMAIAGYWKAALAQVPRVTIEIVFLGFVLTVLVVAVTKDAVEEVLSTLGLFAYAGLRMQPSLQKIARSLNDLRYAEAPVTELADDLALLQSSIRERDRGDKHVAPLQFREEIRFEDVSFRYPGAARLALDGVDLRIPCGTSLGIAGKTGDGKSTLLDLLCGLLLPTEGRVTVDGVDVALHTRAWQRNIGVVHQSSFLIDDTLRRNVTFGIPDKEIDEEAVRFAIEMVELAELVEGLPDGLDTVVGERGVRLSGGQRQRVTLARAIYRRPRLLVLDEGTSALDNTTERRILANLIRLGADVTLVMVAHRLTSVMHCDRIVFLDAGRVSGIGTYEELRRENAAFRAMAG